VISTNSRLCPYRVWLQKSTDYQSGASKASLLIHILKPGRRNGNLQPQHNRESRQLVCSTKAQYEIRLPKSDRLMPASGPCREKVATVPEMKPVAASHRDPIFQASSFHFFNFYSWQRSNPGNGFTRPHLFSLEWLNLLSCQPLPEFQQ
jgi:hypothetical protein